MDTVAAMKEELQFSIDMGDEAVDTVQEQIDAWKNLATTINNSSDLTADQKRSLQRDLARTTKQLSKDISNGTTLDTNIAMQSKTVQVEVPKIQNFNIVTNVDQRGQIVETSGIANWYNQLIAPLVKGTVTDEILKRGGNV
jgi:gas vesicle protein